MIRIALALIVAGAVAGCRGSDFPLTPTDVRVVPPPTIESAPARPSVRGGVADTAYRPLSGARVEVMNGPYAGQSAIADSSGNYSLTGPFDEGTEFRATKDGYAAASRTLQENKDCPTCVKWFLFFRLDVPEPPVNMAGNYTMTLVADGACELPTELRTRTYAAAIRPLAGQNGSASTSFDVTFPGTPFVEQYSSFQIYVAGDYVSFNLEESHGPWLVEQLAPSTFLSIGGVAEASVGPVVSTISTPFRGTIEYRAPMGIRTRCGSQHHRLLMERR